jgi:hypothetical protein
MPRERGIRSIDRWRHRGTDWFEVGDREECNGDVSLFREPPGNGRGNGDDHSGSANRGLFGVPNLEGDPIGEMHAESLKGLQLEPAPDVLGPHGALTPQIVAGKGMGSPLSMKDHPT